MSARAPSSRLGCANALADTAAVSNSILVRDYKLGRPPFVDAQFYATIPFPDTPEAPPPAPPTPHPAPAPTPCPKPTIVNGTTVCFEATDSMTCKGLLACPPGKRFATVDFASIGTPSGICGHFAASSTCHGTAGKAAEGEPFSHGSRSSHDLTC